jgi:serine/threonine protein kinase
MSTSGDTICDRCGKSVDRSGSMTQWLFTSSKCQCSDEAQLQRELKFCPLCGLRIRNREGTMTGWLFRSKACTCLAAELTPQAELNTTELPDEHLIEEEPFEWLARAGEGGQGVVYKAKDRKLGRLMAVKILQENDDDPNAVANFLREAKAASKLHHPNIVTVADFGIMKNGRQYLAIEWIDGITLADYLTRHGTLSIDAAEEIFTQILDGLSHAHKRGVIHRDIKPKNIMLSRTASGGWTVKLIDFGTAKDITDEGYQTRAEDMACSPFYVSPERVNGLLVDQRADLYSLGCTIFEALTGRPPFRGAAMQVVMMHLGEQPPTLAAAGGKFFPLYLEDIIAKLMAKDRDKRFQSAEEAKIALQQHRVDQPEKFEDRFLQNITATIPGGMFMKRSTLSARTIFIATGVVGLVGLITWYFLDAALKPIDLNEKLTPDRVHADDGTEIVTSPMTSTSALKHNLGAPDVHIAENGTSVEVHVPGKEQLAKMKSLVNVRRLTLNDCQPMSDTTLVGISSQDTIERLTIAESTGLNAKNLAPLKNFSRLRHLKIGMCEVNEEALNAMLQNPSMTELELSYCDFEPQLIKTIGTCTRLRDVSIDGARYTDADLRGLKPLKLLHRLNIGNSSIDGSCLAELSCRDSLEILLVHNIANLKPANLAVLQKFPSLRHIEFNNNKVTKEVALQLASIHQLKTLGLPECQIAKNAYSVIGGMKQLEELSLSDTITSDTDLKQLEGLENLHFLSLKGAFVSVPAVDALRSKCKLLGSVIAPWGPHPPPAPNSRPSEGSYVQR